MAIVIKFASHLKQILLDFPQSEKAMVLLPFGRTYLPFFTFNLGWGFSKEQIAKEKFCLWRG